MNTTPSPARARARAAGVAALAVGGLALTATSANAAGAPIPPLSDWFGSASIWGGVVMGLVAFTRANLLPDLRGAAVIALDFAVAIAGALLASSGVLAPIGMTLEGGVGAAVVFGITAGGIAAGLWDAGTGLARKAGAAQAAALAAAPLRLLPSSGSSLTAAAAPDPLDVNPAALTDYLLGLIRARFGDAIPAVAFGILETLAREFAGRALTEDVRAQIQRRLLDLLAALGAPGRDAPNTGSPA